MTVETTRVEIEGCYVMTTDAGPVCMINTNFVDPKVCSIFKYILDEFSDVGHGLTSIIFRNDGYPSLSDEDFTTWVYQPDSMSAVCNLQHVVEAAVAITVDKSNPESSSIGIKAMVWMQLLKGMLHEIHHAQSYMVDRKLLDTSDEARQIEETEADEYSLGKLKNIAKEIDIEPHFSEIIGHMIHQEYNVAKVDVNELINGIEGPAKKDSTGSPILTEDEQDKVDFHKRWLTLQDHMMTTGLMWYTDGGAENDDGNALSVESFKEYMCWLDDGDMADPEWAKLPIGVQQVAMVVPAPNADGAHTTTAPVQNEPVVLAGGWVANDPNEEIIDDEYWQEEDQMAAPTYTPAPTAAPTYAPAPTAPVYNPAPEAAPQQGGFQNNQYAPTPTPAAAAPPAPAPATYQPNVQSVVNSGMTGPQMGQLMHGLYKRLFDHVFLGCQWDKVVFHEKSAINIPIPLSPEENNVITGMVAQNETGAYMELPADGYVTGKIMDRQKELPGYEIKFIDPDGKPGVRKLVPQNPKKTKGSDGTLTYTADMAAHGWQIIWVIDPNAADKKLTTRMMREPGSQVIKVENNRNGKWE